MFKTNEGIVDRVARVIVGLAMIVTGFFFMSGMWGTLVGVIGFLPVVTGAIGWCPAYVPFNISTVKKES